MKKIKNIQCNVNKKIKHKNSCQRYQQFSVFNTNKNFTFLTVIVAICLSFGKCEKSENTYKSLKNKNISFYSYEALQSQYFPQTFFLMNRFRRQPKHSNERPIKIIGIRVEGDNLEIFKGVPKILSDTEQKIRVFGSGITKQTIIGFTTKSNQQRGSCLKPDTELFPSIDASDDGISGSFIVKFPKSENLYYICAKNDKNTDGILADSTKPLIHQGDSPWVRIQTEKEIMPVWISIILIMICLCLSALCSGLNLGLLTLNRTDLKILRNAGTEKERKFAAKIQPIRDQGNYLLCSILLGNVLVNSTFTILLDGLTSGVIAVIGSTMFIVIFGEIVPQAVCSRHGLFVGAKTIHLTKVLMAITAPISYPISAILDWIMGEEIGSVYNRDRLKELVNITTDVNELDKDEVNIIYGALELRQKKVADIMTPIEDAFMLSIDAILDFETVSEIMKSGYSRVPVYDGDRKNIVTLLYIKDLAFVDTDDNTPLKTLCEFYQNPVYFVSEDYTLDIVLNQFKNGYVGHIAIVQRVTYDGETPTYEITGLVTLEDVIEEVLRAEIVDEFDIITDNRTKTISKRRKIDFSDFAGQPRGHQTVKVSPQLTLAAFQYLSTAVDLFKKEYISEQVLRRLLTQDIYRSIKINKDKTKDDASLYIYTLGKPSDYFVLLLEGRAEVTIGKEGLKFEAGPFTYFGTQALVTDSSYQLFIPDYTVRATDNVTYIIIKQSVYLAARKANMLELSRKSNVISEIDLKLALSVSGYDITNEHPTQNQQIRSSEPKSKEHLVAYVGPENQIDRSNEPSSQSKQKNDEKEILKTNGIENSKNIGSISPVISETGLSMKSARSTSTVVLVETDNEDKWVDSKSTY